MSSDRALDIWRQYFRTSSGLIVPLSHIEHIRRSAAYDDRYFLAKTDVIGEDARGETGTYTATFRVCPNPSPRLEIELGIPLGGRPLFSVVADYSKWPAHHKLRVHTLGARENQATPSVGAIPYVLPDGTLAILPLKQYVHYRGARAHGEIVWKDDRGTDSYHPNGAERFGDLKLAWDAVREFEGIKPNPGGRPRGSRKGLLWEQADFIEWWREASEDYAGDGSRVTLTDLADALGVSTDTASTRLKDVGLPWPPESYPERWDPDPDD